MKHCFSKFRSSTSNNALKLCRCVICARELGEEEGEMSRLLDDSTVRNILQPCYGHPGHVLWQGALVLGDDIQQESDGYIAWICRECSSALGKERLPRHSLANSLWIGEIPNELGILTIPEQLLIARHYPRCYVFKLYPRDGYLSTEQLQRGMRGNVSLYELNTKEVVEMLEGQMMPNPPASLASALVITFVGSMSLEKDWLKSTFRIRRHCVHEALMWLKRNNALYKDIRIDEERLQVLPEDGVPEELVSLIRHEVESDVVEKEREGYTASKEDRFNFESEGEF
jgi:hypothetical protein